MKPTRLHRTIKNLKIPKRRFWTVGRGTVTGYVQQIRTRGLFFKHREIVIKESINSRSEGNRLPISLEKMSDEKRKKCYELARDSIKNGDRVNVKYRGEMLNFPWYSNMCGFYNKYTGGDEPNYFCEDVKASSDENKNE